MVTSDGEPGEEVNENLLSERHNVGATSLSTSESLAMLVSVSRSKASDCFKPKYFGLASSPGTLALKNFLLQKTKVNPKKTGIFICSRRYSKTAKASHKFRQNLRAHIESKHLDALKSFDELCNKNDKKKQRPIPASTAIHIS